MLLAVPNAWAVPEAQLAGAVASEIEPYWRSGAEGSFEGKDGVSIHFHKFEAKNEKAAVVVVPGRAEPAAKYAELVYDLRKSGYSFYVMDLRGQGESGRMTTDPQIGHVEHFEDYASDLKQLMESVVNSKPHAKRFIIAHSTGGAAAALYLMQNPKAVNGAALVAPMFDLSTGVVPKPLAYSLANAAVLAGRGSSYAIGRGPWKPRQTIREDKTTKSAVRFALVQKLLAEHAELRTGGPSYRWVQQAIEAETSIRLNGPSKISTPLLMMEAGDDQVVHIGAQQKFCAAAAHCEGALYPGAGHSILSERDSVRDDAIGDILEFFAKN